MTRRSAHDHDAALDESVRTAAGLTELEASPADLGPVAVLGPARALALQRSIGNAALCRLVHDHDDRRPERTPQGSASTAAATTAPAVTPFAWRDAALGAHVDANGTAEQIATHLSGLDPGARDTAIADLQGARREYHGRIAGAADDATRTDLRDRRQRADVGLHGHYRDVAQTQTPGGPMAPEGGWATGSRPAGLMTGTHTPTTAERDQLRDAMAPPRARTATGALADFHSMIPSHPYETYENRIFRALTSRIDRLYSALVGGKGVSEHRDEANLNPWTRYEALAAAAKRETDAVFGTYVRGPVFSHMSGRHLGNLRDRFDEQRRSQGQLGPRGRRRQAEELLEYFLQSGSEITQINSEHSAVPERTVLSPGETRSEAQILRGAVTTLAEVREQQLLDIDRGWEGTASGGIVSLQRWRVADEPGQSAGFGQRHHFWDVFQTMIHEYLHTLTHAAYYTYANTLPGGSAGLQYNTLVEGMTSAMTEIVWVNVAPRVRTQTLAQEIEADTYVDPDRSTEACPPIPRRYPSYHQAMELISIVGPRNVFAAYLLGEVDLIRASAPAAAAP